MLEYNEQYETHPLYNHFKNWIDMDDSYTDSYFIINTSLYAAEKYIYNTYGIAIRAAIINEYLGDVTDDIVYPKFNLQNLIGVYTNNGYVLPKITYYDTAELTVVQTEGEYAISDGNLVDVDADGMSIEYVTGYTFPEELRNTYIIPQGNTASGIEASSITITNADGAPLYSPLSTNKTYFDISVIGDIGADIYVNDVLGELRDAQGNLITEAINPNVTINSERVGKVTLTLVNGINTFEIKTVDDGTNESYIVTIVINKQDKFKRTSVELLDKSLVTNDGTFTVKVGSALGSTINVNGVDKVTYSTGVDVISDTLLTEGTQPIVITVTSPTGTVSEPLTTHIIYDSTLDDKLVRAINDINFNSTTMPPDVMMALLMIAHHYFKIALYKHEDTQSYGDNVSNRITFVADRFPKEAHRILSQHVRYI